MSVLVQGKGRPITAYAKGRGAIDGTAFAVDVRGTGLFFEWEESGHADLLEGTACEADRDAVELRAVADEYGATQVLGASRGARAVLGVLGDDPGRFERVALVLPPGRRPAGRYADWLADPSIPSNVDIIVIGQQGDETHPAGVAEEWAQRLGARLELFPTGGVLRAHKEQFHATIAAFMNPDLGRDL